MQVAQVSKSTDSAQLAGKLALSQNAWVLSGLFSFASMISKLALISNLSNLKRARLFIYSRAHSEAKPNAGVTSKVTCASLLA